MSPIIEFWNKHKFLVIFLPLGIILDQVTKIIAVNYLQNNATVYLGDFFTFHLSYNTGMAWSLFDDNTIILAIVSLVLSIAILTYYFLGKGSKWEKYSLVVIASGAIGNLIDRVATVRGDLLGVIDFLRFGEAIDIYKMIFGNGFPTFNVADSFITCGAISLFLSILFARSEKAVKNG